MRHITPNTKVMLTTTDVINTFETEYGIISDRFAVFELTVNEAQADKRPEVNAPGVYVHWSPTLGVVKVGKHQTNSKMRSMQHLQDNTSSKDRKYGMAQLASESGAKILLFNVVSKEHIHWILGLEHFMEMRLNPYIGADRVG